ncbi:hypothetical protein RHMOL_Rhmol08G0132500 [Rhododendron molle]|uniref:Uncharacterized protein n=1 Tax=Rhododendron molle TaxID=49168 RepID=A0ACC0MP10_RHOML|nr:hypothetical protein RHMOL_Rhmol08G0132500 [Rhododendron molle]
MPTPHTRTRNTSRIRRGLTRQDMKAMDRCLIRLFRLEEDRGCAPGWNMPDWKY